MSSSARSYYDDLVSEKQNLRTDFQPDDVVQITNIGQICSTYDRWAREFGLTKWKSGAGSKSSPNLYNGVTGLVVAAGCIDRKMTNYRVAVEVGGFEYIFCNKGLKLISRPPKKVFNDDLFTI